ncbi:MAG TPA: tRNA uridine(34) 5-carboxymethylaminomethyl modification radical SAM/GNAT enzyme Elp3 [Candidatus Kapabacteria bacterium]|nr:tRNA uridine(34) 5-carboxymethylaminomethyl modification radical SAM/GNAT enzyme Elp3 [Candidatus Kapabacteria bacterium]
MPTVKTVDTAETILRFIIEQKPTTKAQFERARQQICSSLKVNQPPNRELLEAYQTLVKKKSLEASDMIEYLLRKAQIRSESGIAIITSLVKPYMCPGRCVYCPTEVRMPKSYIATEPAAARALRLDFSPYEQMRQRILMLERNGHPTDKIEYIIKGGTWNAYPLKYQYWFILESFKACNDFARRKAIGPEPIDQWEKQPLEQMIAALDKEQTYNEGSKHRIIGLTLETRPDAISPKTIAHMRNQGCTRIELGLQAPDDAILTLIQRGHTVEQFRIAMKLLRRAGFKVDLHFMPDLPGTTPDHDVEMYQSLFSDPGLKPDMVKIYPNTVIPSAELYQWYLDGRYKPYGDKALFDALLCMKLATPRYCRISRLIRDIPSTEITAGNTVTNLREMLEVELKKRGQRCECLRCREVSRQRKHITEDTIPQLFIEQYETIGGTEYFLSLEDEERTAVFAFLRLRIPEQTKDKDTLFTHLPEIEDCAFIRELHTYGQLVSIGKKDATASQHKGMGKKLVAEAERIAKENGFPKLAIISGVGVRGYYRKLGYKKEGTYMIKRLKK